MGNLPHRREVFAAHEANRFGELVSMVALLSEPDDEGNLRIQDTYQQAYLKALLPRLGDPQSPVVNRLYKNVLDTYDERPIINIINNGIRCGNAYYLRKYPYDFSKLKALSQPEAWDEYFWALEDEADAMEQARFATYFEFNVQTTVPQRGASVIAATHLLDRLGPFSVLDVGNGRGHVLGAMALSRKEFYYEPIGVFIEDEQGRIVPRPKADDAFNELVNRPFEVGQSVGIDIQEAVGSHRPRNVELRDWASKNFYLSEYINNIKRIIDFWMLEDAMPRLQQIQFFQGDITQLHKPEMRETFEAAYPGFKADIALFSVICEQLGKEGTRNAIANTRPYMNDSHLKIFQLFGRMRSDSTVELADFWPPWSLRTYIADSRQPEMGTQHFFTIRTGRVNEIALAPAAAKLAMEKGIEL